MVRVPVTSAGFSPESASGGAATKTTSVLLDARQWGVKGDNTTDNATPLASFVTALTSEGPGGRGVLPAGQIKTSAPLTFCPGVTGASGLHIEGQGQKATSLVKTFNGDLVKMNGVDSFNNAGGVANHNRYSSLSKMALSGGTGILSGRLIDTAYADNLTIRDIYFGGNADTGIDTTETWDSLFDNLTFETCGSLIGTSSPNIWVRSSRAASGFGASTDTSNVLRFNNIRCETFTTNGIRVEAGTGGNNPNQIWITEIKCESFALTNAAPIFVTSANAVYLDKFYIYLGDFTSGFSTPVSALNWTAGLDSAVTNGHIGNGSIATVSQGINLFTASPVYINNVAGQYATAPSTGFHLNAGGGGPYTIGNLPILGGGATNHLAGGVIRNAAPASKITTAVSYTVLTNDEFIGVSGQAGAVTVSLPAGTTVQRGQRYVIKDEGGAAAARNITVAANGADTIDGAATQLINTNFGVLRLVATGNNTWSVW